MPVHCGIEFTLVVSGRKQDQIFLVNIQFQVNCFRKICKRSAVKRREPALCIEIGSALQKIHAQERVHGVLSPFCIVLAVEGARILEAAPSPEDHAPYRARDQLCGEEPEVRSGVFGLRRTSI